MEFFIKKFAPGLVLIIFLVIISCHERNDDQDQLVISGVVTHYSDCKGFRLNGPDQARSDTVCCMTWEYNSSSNSLDLKHLNVYFNCYPGLIRAWIHEENDTIFIAETEEMNAANCLCPYDLYMELTGVSRKIYMVELNQPYAWAWGVPNPAYFEMDLITFPVGQQCW